MSDAQVFEWMISVLIEGDESDACALEKLIAAAKRSRCDAAKRVLARLLEMRK